MPNQRAPGRSRGPAIWAGLLVVSMYLLTATLGGPVQPPTTGGAGWLPSDGHRLRLAGPDGVLASEWAIDFAPSMLTSGPAPFASWFRVTEVDWRTAQLARLSTVRLNLAGEFDGRSDDLFSIGPGGVRAEVVSGFDGTSLAFVPGRLDLPDTMAAGSSWTSEGVAQVTDSAGTRSTTRYRADFSAASPGDKALLARACVVVTMRQQLGENPAETGERTWCRHEGSIAFATDAGRWQAAGNTPSAVAADPAFDWATADRLTFTPRRINHTVSVDEPGNTLVTPVSPPGILPDGTVVYTNGISADLLALQTVKEPPPVMWWARPGQRSTAAATFDTITVAASVNREMVAYGPSGEWLWEVRLPDLSVVTPARIGEQVVVATLDGGVAAYDLATGQERWRQQMPAEIRVSPVVAADRVLVVDQGGQLACFDPAGNDQWRVDVGAVARFAVTPGDDPVVVVPNSDGPRVTGLSLADGKELWRPRHPFNAQGVIALHGVVVLRYEKETIAIDPATGRQVWAWRGTRTAAGIGGGNRVLLLGADRVFLLDENGRVVTEWPVSVGDAFNSTSTYLVAAQGRVLIHGPGGVEIGVVK